jgi:hypothetical protein
MTELRSAVMIVAEAWWEGADGSLEKGRVRIVNKSAWGACVRMEKRIGVGAKLRIESRWDEFVWGGKVLPERRKRLPGRNSARGRGGVDPETDSEQRGKFGRTGSTRKRCLTNPRCQRAWAAASRTDRAGAADAGHLRSSGRRRARSGRTAAPRKSNG